MRYTTGVAMSVQLKIDVPEEALSVLRKGPDEFADELKTAAVAKWYELGWISQSKAAQILRISREQFLAVLARYGVSPFQVTPEELAEEVERA